MWRVSPPNIHKDRHYAFDLHYRPACCGRISRQIQCKPIKRNGGWIKRITVHLETLWNKVSTSLTTQWFSPCVYTCTSSCLTSYLCLNVLCIVFTVYANSVILNKTSVSGVRMIDYGSQARSPQRAKEPCLTLAVNTISVLYECHEQSNDLLLGRVRSIFPPSLSLPLFFVPDQIAHFLEKEAKISQHID